MAESSKNMTKHKINHQSKNIYLHEYKIQKKCLFIIYKSGFYHLILNQYLSCTR